VCPGCIGKNKLFGQFAQSDVLKLGIFLCGSLKKRTGTKMSALFYKFLGNVLLEKSLFEKFIQQERLHSDATFKNKLKNTIFEANLSVLYWLTHEIEFLHDT
jgi:hypothetical protein